MADLNLEELISTVVDDSEFRRSVYGINDEKCEEYLQKRYYVPAINFLKPHLGNSLNDDILIKNIDYILLSLMSSEISFFDSFVDKGYNEIHSKLLDILKSTIVELKSTIVEPNSKTIPSDSENLIRLYLDEGLDSSDSIKYFNSELKPDREMLSNAPLEIQLLGNILSMELESSSSSQDCKLFPMSDFGLDKAGTYFLFKYLSKRNSPFENYYQLHFQNYGLNPYHIIDLGKSHLATGILLDVGLTLMETKAQRRRKIDMPKDFLSLFLEQYSGGVTSFGDLRNLYFLARNNLENNEDFKSNREKRFREKGIPIRPLLEADEGIEEFENYFDKSYFKRHWSRNKDYHSRTNKMFNFFLIGGKTSVASSVVQFTLPYIDRKISRLNEEEVSPLESLYTNLQKEESLEDLKQLKLALNKLGDEAKPDIFANRFLIGPTGNFLDLVENKISDICFFNYGAHSLASILYLADDKTDLVPIIAEEYHGQTDINSRETIAALALMQVDKSDGSDALLIEAFLGGNNFANLRKYNSETHDNFEHYLFHQTFPWLVAYAKSFNLEKIMVNTNHSGSQSVPESFVYYAARLKGFQEGIDFTYKSEKKGLIKNFKLDPNSCVNIEKKPMSDSLCLGGNRVFDGRRHYNNTWYNYNVLLGNSHPEINDCRGLAQVVEFDVSELEQLLGR